jgi:hypothetical protein
MIGFKLILYWFWIGHDVLGHTEFPGAYRISSEESFD